MIEKNTLFEILADIEHQRWSDWQAYCHKVLRENCPSPELEKILVRWDRQIATRYSDLSEKEKESDREQVRRYWHLLVAPDPRVERLIAAAERAADWIEKNHEMPGYSETLLVLRQVLAEVKKNG